MIKEMGPRRIRKKQKNSRKKTNKESYYVVSLSSQQLRSVYETAPARIQQYLKAEIDFVLSRINPGDKILELGCGYGRVINFLAEKARIALGIDLSLDSLFYAVHKTELSPFLCLSAQDAALLGIKDNSFNVVLCIQNGISALHLNPYVLVGEAMRVLAPGGRLLLSSYSENFWDERLDWFRFQAESGLIGEIDEEKTGNGIIVCKDGFTATTFSPEDFIILFSKFNRTPELTEVDKSSIFCEVRY